ncbi:hypothetical protein NDA13_003849 [Ustilago tritici]|nr:hypothetical protein NDA13_003849 [Ustilago tritici]
MSSTFRRASRSVLAPSVPALRQQSLRFASTTSTSLLASKAITRTQPASILPLFQLSNPFPSPFPRTTAIFARPSSTASTTLKSEPKPESESEPEPEPDPDAPPPKATLRERLRFLTRRYGWWALGVYLLASTVDFSLTFLAIHLLGADHIRSLESSLRTKLGLEQRAEHPSSSDPTDGKKGGSGSGTLWTEAVLAYTIHKTLLLPVRVAFTAAVTPSFVKWLVKMGWAKANYEVKAKIGRKAADQAISEVVKRNAATKAVKETMKH